MKDLWEFVKDAAPDWSVEYHIPIVVGIATLLLLFALCVGLLVRRGRNKRLYGKFRSSKW
ncbi:MAG: hypothetical protein ACFCBV_07335 [Phycisphaerales bacterium]